MKRIFLGLLASLAAAGVLAAPAQAETADHAYLRLISMENASAKDAEQLITLGHNVCDALKAGNSQSSVINALRENMPTLVNADDEYAAAMAAGSIVGASQYAYCPDV